MPSPLTVETIARAPKVLLHDHLDGGLRPRTILELADEAGYRDLPAQEPDALAAQEPAGTWELGRVALVLAIWCVVGLVLCVRTFRWQDRGTD